MNTDRAVVRRRAARLLRRAGRQHLADLGLRLAGSSPRHWLGDHGWWLINVEFQASSWSVGSYLDVGRQYLWTVTERRTFGHGNHRVDIAGWGDLASLEGDDEDATAAAEAVGRSARAVVLELTEQLRDDPMHLEWLSQRAALEVRDGIDSAIAAGLLGRPDEVARIFDRTTAGTTNSSARATTSPSWPPMSSASAPRSTTGSR